MCNVTLALKICFCLSWKVYFFEFRYVRDDMHIRFQSSCGTNLGQSIAVVAYNICAIGVVKPVYGHPTFTLIATAV